MLGFIAHRSLEAAAAKHGGVRELAAGDVASQLAGEQILVDNAPDGQIQRSYTTPREPDAFLQNALLPEDQIEEVAEYDEYQSAIAAAVIEADFIKTAGSDAPAVYRDLDSFPPAVSGGGGDFSALINWR